MSGTGRGEPLWLRDEGRGLHTQECGRMGAGRAGPAARAWFLVCVSGGSCVCRLLSWGRLGCPARNTGLPGTPLPPRGCPPRLPSKQLILGQVGAVSAGAPRPFPAEAALAWALQAQEPGLRFPGGPAAVLLAASPAFPTGALQGASARRSAGSGDRPRPPTPLPRRSWGFPPRPLLPPRLAHSGTLVDFVSR